MSLPGQKVEQQRVRRMSEAWKPILAISSIRKKTSKNDFFLCVSMLLKLFSLFVVNATEKNKLERLSIARFFSLGPML
jgi:hypothetical protein